MTLQVSNKNNQILMGFVLAVSIIISIPLVMPHASHMDGILHLSIHAAGFVLASFLTVMGVISWRKTKIPRMFFSSLAFATRHLHKEFTCIWKKIIMNIGVWKMKFLIF